MATVDDYVAPEGDYNTNIFEYQIGTASCGDLDGDGEYEIIVKHEANHAHAQAVWYGNRLLEAYKLDGTLLWRIDMGRYMLPITEFVFLVYDFNNDGIAEVACKPALGTKDGTGNYVTEASKVPEIKNADNDKEYEFIFGRLYKGLEYFTLFDGRNGQALDTIEYPILRGMVNDPNNEYNNWFWGTPNGRGDNGHRGEKCMGTVAYLDDVNPGIVLWRGIYTRIVAAGITVDENSRMSIVSRFDTTDYAFTGADEEEKYDNGYREGYEKYEGQGNHSIACGDVDNDGKDEVMSGGLCLDDDMSPLWCTYRGHGDAHHLGEYDPTNNSLEYLTVHEHGNTDGSWKITNDFGEEITMDFGMTLIHAADGKELYHAGAGGDTGRGMMTNVGVGGYYQISGAGMAHGYGKTTDADNDPQTDSIDDTYDIRTDGKGAGGNNFRIFWDGDLYDEMFDGADCGRPAIYKYKPETDSVDRIFYDTETVTINSTKANSLLQADIFGDWCEEVVLKTPDDMAIRIYTTDIPTENKFYTLMHDPLYRQGVALQNQYYCQPSHIGFYVCEESDPLFQNGKYDERAVKPDIETVKYSGGKPSVTPTPVKQAKAERSGEYLIDEDGDYYKKQNDASPFEDMWKVTTDGLAKQTLIAAINDAPYLAPAHAKSRMSNYSNKFLLFSANGADSKLETKAAKPLTGSGKLEFVMSIPSTFSANGEYAHGNAPARIYIRNDTGKALEFTITPNTAKGYTESAVLSVNGVELCSYPTGREAQKWTKIECTTDNAQKKAYITATKYDRTVYSAEVSYITACAEFSNFGVEASKNYGTIALDEIKLYGTDTFEKPSAKPTAAFEPVVAPTKEPMEKMHFYQLDLSDSASGIITGKQTSTEEWNPGSYNVPDFGDGTMKSGAIPELDGWGYRHAAFNDGRQTGAGVNAENNELSVHGVPQVAGGALFFIPQNVDGLAMPEGGKLIYKFKAKVAAGSIDYGFTSSLDGADAHGIAWANVIPKKARRKQTKTAILYLSITTLK